MSQVRLEHAKRLLCSELSVKEVAFALGFGSSTAFCYAFRRETRQSPLQYRARQLRAAAADDD